ncbi:PREDICTED: cell wall / vacuolar inhibitor of fructosidase 1 [Theobroma cacao]|uniref:Cell wall / vacuolar inhibitor of fructosidase 1 n=1 Tax=Theobroma cacao TaxID=3641 RepID=A0AB32W550_THECC|nr:PREDICTED: cell wall / vacuolar inhibitor of fructosidase 1 [Theobroma cacao]
MKNIIPLVLLQIAFSFTFLPVSALELQGGRGGANNLVETTCKKTPFYNLCLSTLQSDPRSSRADLAGLVHIGADKVKARATATLRQIIGLLRAAKDPKLQTALRDCVDLYDTIIKYDMPVTIEAVAKGNPKFGVQGATDAANEADDCERRFGNPPNSPISGSNKAVHDLCAIVASIAQLLL